MPYVTLRLPDVIGPKDNTYRWWIYQTWMRLADHLDKVGGSMLVVVNLV